MKKTYIVYDGLRKEYLASITERLTTLNKYLAHEFTNKREAARQARLLHLELGRDRNFVLVLTRESDRLDAAIQRVCDRHFDSTTEAAALPKLPLSKLINSEIRPLLT